MADDKREPPPLSAEDRALLDKMRATREATRKRWADKGRPLPLPADSPIFKKWETDEFLPAGAGDPEDPIVGMLERLARSEPRKRVLALQGIADDPPADERVLAACERALEDRAIALFTIPYSYGEVRWVAADAVVAVRAALGRPAPVVLEDTFAPVMAVGKLADAAGIPMEPGANSVESAIRTLERLSALGKLPRRKRTRT